MNRRTPILLSCLFVLTSRLALASPPSPDAVHADRLVHQAAALAERGHLIEARETLMPVALGAAPPAGSPNAAVYAEAARMFAEVGARIPRLRIAVDPPGLGARLVITIDGEALPPGAERLPVPVDPGRHVIVVTSPGMMAQTDVLDAVEGREQPIAVHLRRAAPVAPVTPVPPVTAVSPVAVVASPAVRPDAAMPPLAAQPAPPAPAIPVATFAAPAGEADRAERLEIGRAH